MQAQTEFSMAMRSLYKTARIQAIAVLTMHTTGQQPLFSQVEVPPVTVIRAIR